MSVLFQTKDLGLWYLWVRHQQTDVHAEQWTFTTGWSTSQSLYMLQRLCCTNSLIPFSFNVSFFCNSLTGCWHFSVALLQFEVYLLLILAIKCFALPQRLSGMMMVTWQEMFVITCSLSFATVPFKLWKLLKIEIWLFPSLQLTLDVHTIFLNTTVVLQGFTFAEPVRTGIFRLCPPHVNHQLLLNLWLIAA